MDFPFNGSSIVSLFSSPVFLRENREGWPLLIVETEMNGHRGQMKEDLS
jgi:hypothetical protein